MTIDSYNNLYGSRVLGKVKIKSKSQKVTMYNSIYAIFHDKIIVWYGNKLVFARIKVEGNS